VFIRGIRGFWHGSGHSALTQPQGDWRSSHKELEWILRPSLK
jgi:hypothetical protein